MCKFNYRTLSLFCTLFFIPQLFYTIITEISLDKKVHVGYNRIRKEDYDKLSVILLYLSRESEEEILGFLQTLLDETIQSERKLEILEKDYGIVMDNETRKEIREMCKIQQRHSKPKPTAKAAQSNQTELSLFDF